MSTPDQPDQPDAPQLTRRQLRELRNTASTPIITPEEAAAAATEAEPAPAPVAPLPRAAEPVELPDAPTVPDGPASGAGDADEGPVLTRRQVRDRERLRTASVPVIDDVEAQGEPEAAAEDAPADEEIVELDVVDVVDDEASADDAAVDAVEAAELADDAAAETEPSGDVEDEAADTAEDEPVELVALPADETSGEPADDTTDEVADDTVDEGAGESDADADDSAPVAAPAPARAEVSSAFGAGLLAGDAVEIDLPPSFDQVLGRGSGGTSSPATSNALILSQTPETGAFTAPVTATGEVLVTGTFLLPDSYGSTGSAPGTADGKDIDAVLVDGELPATSSPTPIAASSAISTIKAAEDIIKPPAPEKGSRLMMVLAITAGVLAVALAGVLILAFATGVL
ncbi:hypothetical protein [Microbacterium telephonicum]|uniref:Uncharacterized protein n=1 Tax=Microbacterium telephonicum TaxID=1714841 RepID=A0A498C3G6_9MICO|nr:hypothetical protein [Microbacterium telephonicum]RLK49529.1 hypothetical protein C7474_1688 [Microbacterium telephonicum]